MKLFVYIVLEFMFENSLPAPSDIFDCYGYRCAVGVEYCSEDERHCEPCSQKQGVCGMVNIDSVCHLYCLNLTEHEPSTAHPTIDVTGVPTRPHAAACLKQTRHAEEEQSKEPTLILLAAVFGVMLVLNLSLFFGGLVIHYLKNGPCKQAMLTCTAQLKALNQRLSKRVRKDLSPLKNLRLSNGNSSATGEIVPWTISTKT